MTIQESGSTVAYTVEKIYEGVYEVRDADDGARVARVSKFMPGPMVSTTAAGIQSPASARAIASAMVALANDIEPDVA